MNNLTQEQIDEVEAALEKVTPGIWRSELCDDGELFIGVVGMHEAPGGEVYEAQQILIEGMAKLLDEDENRSNANFIAFAKNLMPALIAAAKEGLEARAIKNFPESYQ